MEAIFGRGSTRESIREQLLDTTGVLGDNLEAVDEHEKSGSLICGHCGEEEPHLVRSSVQAVVRRQSVLVRIDVAPLAGSSVGMDPCVGRMKQPGIDDGGADALPLSRLVAMVDRSRYGDRREEGVAGVAHVGTTPQGRVTRITGSVLPLGPREGSSILIGARQL